MTSSLVGIFTLLMAAAEPSGPVKNVSPNLNVGDPNERICETITPIGSRLATKRFCGTRAEWADRRLQDKQALEKAQMGPCVVNGTTCK